MYPDRMALVCTKKIFSGPIIIAGAPRSGTKMLRELLKLHPGTEGSVYEKERIWCYGNREKMGRAIGVRHLTPEVREYIRKKFRDEAKESGGKWIVDKSVVHTLRIEFVRAVFPGSPIIHIVRDGRDTAVSSMKRWKKPADFEYIIKNRAFPLKELPWFLKRQVKWKLEKIVSGKRHVRWWGPKFDDMEELRSKYSLIEICGIQWSRCVESALAGLRKMANDYYIQVRYEDLVYDTVETMEGVFEFLGLAVSKELRDDCRKYVKSSSVGRWKRDLSLHEYKLIMKQISKTMSKLGYGW